MVIVVITARPSYARVKTVLEGLRTRDVRTGVVAAASAVLPHYGRVVDQIRADGFTVLAELPAVVAGGTVEASVLSTASLTHSLGLMFAQHKPRLVVTVADRHETLATAIAASYQHIPLFHLLAGEHSGNIDEKVRGAVAALADYHYEALKDGGCPSVDLAARAAAHPPVSVDELGGTGSLVELSRPFITLLQHPVTSEAAKASDQIETTIQALIGIDMPVVALWPGEDAGGDAMAKMLRQMKENYLGNHAWHFVRSIPPERFYRLLMQTACLVGNSSVGVRECAYLGTPVVDIGTRQQDRRHAKNVWHVPHTVESIRSAVKGQLMMGRYSSSSLYGDGNAGDKVAQWIHDLVS